MNAEVWVLLPPNSDSAKVGPIRATLSRESTARGWGLQVRPTHQLADKPFLSSKDTDALYRRLHRARVVVVSIQAPGSPGPHFFKRPPPASARTYSPGNIASVRTLCRHKGLFYRWRWDRSTAEWGPIFASWCERIQCEGPEDPRCLPLHVFQCQARWSKEIARSEGRVSFDACHGTGHERTDEVGLRWRRGGVSRPRLKLVEAAPA
jgi:hypothetical protein